MRSLRNQAHWVVALVGGFCLVAAAVTVAQRTTLPEPVSVKNAHELSQVFRKVANTALPSVVTIVTKSKVDEANGNSADRLEEFFQGDPRFRDFFRQLPRQPLQQRPRQGMGSGFIVDESGIIVTNNHVVKDADEILVRLQDGREFVGTDVKTDPRTDLAILKIDAGEDLEALRFGDSDSAQIGDWVIAVGNPFGQELTVTSGIISAKGRGPRIAEREDFLQTDAAINPGNSGGPLMNLNGDVIGINTAISSRSGGFDGIGFAIPSRMAWWVVNQLIENGSVERAYIGITIQQMTNDLAGQFGVRVGEGAVVTNVIPNSPGDTAGLKVQDVVLSLAGNAVSGPRSLQGIVERLEVDKKYPIEILREGKRSKQQIVLKPMPSNYTLARVMRRRPEQPADRGTATLKEFGFSVQGITDELAEQRGLPDTKGVIVTAVDPNGPAADSLAVGEVILKVTDADVTDLNSFQAAINKADPKKGLVLYVRADKETRFEVIKVK